MSRVASEFQTADASILSVPDLHSPGLDVVGDDCNDASHTEFKSETYAIEEFAGYKFSPHVFSAFQTLYIRASKNSALEKKLENETRAKEALLKIIADSKDATTIVSKNKEVFQLRETIEKFTAKEKKIESERNKLKSQISKLRKQLKEANEAVDKRSQDQDDEIEQVRKHEKEKREILILELARSKRIEMESLRKENEELKKQDERVEDKADIQKLYEQIKALEQDRARQEDEMQKLQVQVAQQEIIVSKNSLLQDEVSSLQSAKKHLRSRLSEAWEKNDDQQTEINKMDDLIYELHDFISDTEKGKALGDAKERVTKVENENEKLDARLQTATGELTKARNEIERMRKDHEISLAQTPSSQQVPSTGVITGLEDLQSQIAHLKSRLDRSISELKATNLTITEQNDRINELKRKCSVNTSDTAALLSEYADCLGIYRGQKDKFIDEINNSPLELTVIRRFLDNKVFQRRFLEPNNCKRKRADSQEGDIDKDDASEDEVKSETEHESQHANASGTVGAAADVQERTTGEDLAALASNSKDGENDKDRSTTTISLEHGSDSRESTLQLRQIKRARLPEHPE